MRVHAPDHNAYVDFPDGTPQEEIKAAMDKHFGMSSRPDHDNLAAAAVTGEDSLQLQETDPTVKPVVKMTPAELLPMYDRVAGKLVIIWQGAAYVLDPTAIDPTEALPDILSGDDSAILGYPARGDHDAAVTKQGEVVTDLPTMKMHADAGNVAWAASGNGQDLMDKAQKVSAAIQQHMRTPET